MGEYWTNTTSVTQTGWHYWNQGTNSATTDYTYYQLATSTATSATNDIVWVRWNEYSSLGGANQTIARVTPEEAAAIQARRHAELAARQAAAEIRAQELKEATDRAVQLLQEELNAEQKKEYAKSQSFTVISGKNKRTYRIDHGFTRNVRLLRADGSIEKTLCAHPVETDMPIPDHQLAQKLFLEHDEEGFLAIANVS